MAATLFNNYPNTILNSKGNIAVGARAYFYAAGTTILINVFQDSNLTIAYKYPIEANANGVLPPIYLPYQAYAVKIVTFNEAEQIYFADGIANPLPPTAGGGAGIVVSSADIFQLGFTVFRFEVTPILGWVRLNGNTVGNALSSATELQSDAAFNIFSYLWSKFPDTICPVSGGRGASALTDWNANKTITLLDMSGRCPVGLDDTGASARNVIQISRLAAVTNGSSIVIPSSITDLARGMSILINGVFVGKIVDFPSVSSIQLDAVYTGVTAASASMRASYFMDAQLPGARGGATIATPSVLEMPAHTHSAVDAGHLHGVGLAATIAAVAAGPFPVNVISQTNTNTTTSTTGITNQNTGGGKPLGVVQPSMLGCWFMKT